MTLATFITLLRIMLVPVMVVLLLLRLPQGDWGAMVVFILAAVTDGLDGYFARSRNEVTPFGIFVDPLADKLLISAALVVLVILHRVPLWMAVVIIGREVAVTILRLIKTGEGKSIAASPWGKAKTVSQIVAITAVLINFPGNFFLLLVAVGLTVISGLDYFVRFARLR